MQPPIRGNQQGFAHLKLPLLCFFVLMLLSLAFWRASYVTRSMSVVAESASAMRQAKPDSKTKIVVEVSDTDANGLIHGTLLEKKTEEQYTRTKTLVTAQATDATKMVMGKREDVHKGAVVHITGRARGDGTVDAEQIVILTQYVKVE